MIGSYEAKTHLASILNRVAKGESFTITKRGQPIAVLSPVQSSAHESLDAAVGKIRELRKKFKLGKVTLKSLIESGRE